MRTKRPFPKQAMLLAAGKGERLRPITEHLAKPLWPLLGYSLIELRIMQLAHLGVEDIWINLFHLGEQIAAALGDGTKYGLKLNYSREDELLGTGGGIHKMLPNISDAHFICMNADTLSMPNLAEAFQMHQGGGAMATMVLSNEELEGNEAKISIDASGVIQAMLGVKRAAAPSATNLRNLLFTGIHFFHTEKLKQALIKPIHCINQQGYTAWLKQDANLRGYVADGPFSDVGTPRRYLSAFQTWLQAQLDWPDWLQQAISEQFDSPKEGVFIHNRATVAVELSALRPPLMVDSGAQIQSESEIGPSVYVGKKASVGKLSKLKCAMLIGENNAAETIEAESQIIHLPTGTKIKSAG